MGLRLLLVSVGLAVRGSLLSDSQKTLLQCCTPVERSLEVVNNNLDMLGPGDVMSPPNLRVSGISSGCGMSSHPRSLDAELRATSRYKSDDPQQNGASGRMMRLNLNAGSTVDLTLKLRDSETNQQVQVRQLVLFVYDLDEAAAVSAKGFKDFHLSQSSVIEEDFRNGDQTWFASQPLHAIDAPTDPNQLSKEQRDVTVAFSFAEVDGVSLSFRVDSSKSHTFLFSIIACSCCGSQVQDEIQLYDSSSFNGGNSFNGGSQDTGRSQQKELWQVAGSRTCSGSEISWDVCPTLPSCDNCVPQDCQFAAWGQWYDAGGCTGLCFRHRGLALPNNECGQPCDGVQEDTKPCLKRECAPAHSTDCMLSSWTQWSPCKFGQRERNRDVAQQPAHGGRPCEDQLRQVQACGKAATADCKLNAWSEWTTCSCTCGMGWHTRDRRIVQFSSEGGRPCAGATREEHPCNMQPCAGTPCLLSEWSQWVGCDSQSPMQRERTRRVAKPGRGGLGCAGDTRETEGCQGVKEKDCVFSGWSEWTGCDKTCGGGQQFRTQELVHAAHGGGNCHARPLKQLQGCGQQECHVDDRDCVLGEWGDWSICSARCEEGVHRRSREILRRPGPGGKGCETSLLEVESCQDDDCEQRDCRWSSWDAWSGCSCTCGGGTKRRNRQVEVSPSGGGRLCDPVDKTQISPCNTMSCKEQCIDARWGGWNEWAACSTSCGYGFRWRHRGHDAQANSCGRAAVGHSQEWTVCKGSGIGSIMCGDNDGRLSAWNQWSDCSCTCFGIRERQRIVEEYHSGHGRPIIDMPLKEVEPCNPSPREQAPSHCVHHHADCVLNQWNDWSDCPVSCGGGNKMRLRYILSPAANNGKPCEGSLRETQPCGTAPCGIGCIDCLWGPWSQWGACSKCGDQRFRTRDIIKLPNHCGQRCDAKTAKEVSNCTSSCVKISFCSWKMWTEWSGCSATCGPATRMRQRTLGVQEEEPASYLFKVADEGTAGVCAGAQRDTENCQTQRCQNTCIPQNCVFSQWEEWNQPTCIGLCTRSRHVQRFNNECGDPCKGALQATKRCMEKCTTKLDCELRSWSSWSQYDRQGVGAQRYRSREVSQLPMNGGEPCHGTLREVDSSIPSNDAEGTRDCWLSAWSEWFTCSRTCGGGWQLRTRSVAQAATGGGRTCKGDLELGQNCNQQACEENDCVLGAWSEWSGCWADGQRSRTRYIEQPATPGGTPCGAPGQSLPLTETMSCSHDGIDCEVSDWSSWDACDKSCGGGEQQRHRQVQVYPVNGGKTCPSALRELRPCNMDGGCGSVDCQVGPWSEWGTCSSNCGSGQQQRDRQIVRPPAGSGRACEMSLSETRACRTPQGRTPPSCGVVNCLWGKWSAWSGCTCSCGGGQRTRNRHIASVPQGGGAMCDSVHKEEIEPCNTMKCSEFGCEDGRWGMWQEWTQCSQSCAGGLRYRHRSMEKEANDCGKAAPGLSRDVASCNAGVSCSSDLDCQFGEWSEWSACTRTCDGTKRRSRRIAVHGRGNGKWCVGSTKESSPCNPSPGGLAPVACRAASKQDCKMSSWTLWSQCDATCGGGQERRERSVTHEAAGGGQACEGSLSQTRSCAVQACQTNTRRQDCQWGAWSEWGACNKCGGQRERFRHILHEALGGGSPCRLGAAEETGDCPRKCHDRTFCVWSPWEHWGQCSASCGTGGIRHRQRRLAVKSEDEVQALGLLYEERQPVAGLPALLSQGMRFEVVAAFAAGILGATAFGQVSSWRRRARSGRVSAMEIGSRPLTESRGDGIFSRWLGEREVGPREGYMPVSTYPASDDA